MECFEDNGLIYRTEIKGATFASDNPVSFLGLFELWNSLERRWNCQEPDILAELMAQ